MAAIRNKNCLNVYRTAEHKKLSLVSINNFQMPKAERLKYMNTAHSYAGFVFVLLFEYDCDGKSRHDFV
jgi:hypothetical protein